MKTWKFTTRRSGDERIGVLEAHWEVNYSEMSDAYTTDEITADELFDQWAKEVSDAYDDQLIPIIWSIVGEKIAVYDFMPFQYQDFDIHEDFLTFFTWPVDSKTGAKLDFLKLPVVDKRWRPGRGDKGGFIQEATGWKPSILQPFVYLPSLLQLHTANKNKRGKVKIDEEQWEAIGTLFQDIKATGESISEYILVAAERLSRILECDDPPEEYFEDIIDNEV